jgi:hypothetical protein
MNEMKVGDEILCIKSEVIFKKKEKGIIHHINHKHKLITIYSEKYNMVRTFNIECGYPYYTSYGFFDEHFITKKQIRKSKLKRILNKNGIESR